jgi:AraC-like DNA-binding protein
MLYLTHRPVPPLSDFVDLFWYCEGYDVPHRRERLLPNGTVEIVINLQEDHFFDDGKKQSPLIAAGARSEPFVIDTASLKATAGIGFKGGGATAFLRTPGDRMQNLDVPWDCFWGRGAARLREQLLQAPTPFEKFRVMEDALLAVNPAPYRHPAVSYALQQFERIPHINTVGEVTHRTGFSARRFIQIFREEVGLTPKLFCRVRRFRDALDRMREGHCVRMADLAAGCGYFDQSHFVNDFRAFSGLNPTEYLDRTTIWAGHVPLPD